MRKKQVAWTNHNKQNEQPRYMLSSMFHCMPQKVGSTLDATGNLHINTGKKEGDELLYSVETI